MNQLILVGRLTKDPVVRKLEGKNSCYLNVAVKRPFKNSDGIYETDFLSCIVWNVIAEKVCEYCRKGDMVSIKARVQNNNYIDKEDNKVYSYEIIAEQVSFMQSSKSKEDDEDAIEENREEELLNAE